VHRQDQDAHVGTLGGEPARRVEPVQLGHRDVEELELAIRAALRGERYLDPRVSKQVIEGYVKGLVSDAPAPVLTPRQREILQLIAEGRSTREIAQRLHLSVKTVETHRAQIMDRLDIRDVAGLTRYAIRIGLISGER